MQLLAELIKSVQSLPEEVYSTMHSTLINSANDKDAAVRVQVVIALGKLACGEDLSAREGGVQSLTEILRNLMQFDPSPEVRRAALPGVHTQLNKQTLPLLLSRAKDPDANVRRTVFRVLKTTPVPARSLSLEQRTLVVRCGLGDRTPVVKAEASKLLASWVDSTKDLEGFITLFDLSSDKIAEDALGAVLAERPELLNDIDLSIGGKCSGFLQRQTHLLGIVESFWEEMTAEKALLARVFALLSTSSTSPRDLSDRLPVLTLLAFKIQLLFNTCLNWVQERASGLPRVPGVENNEDNEDEWEEQIMDGVFVLSEMFKLGAYLDFSDEMGRRGIVKLVRKYCSSCTFSKGAATDGRGVQERYWHIQFYQKYLSHPASTSCKRHRRTMQNSSPLRLKLSRPSPNRLILGPVRKLAMRGCKPCSCAWLCVMDCLNGFNGYAFILCA